MSEQTAREQWIEHRKFRCGLSGSAVEHFAESIREHGEGYVVEIDTDDDSKRLVVRAFNQCGHDCTEVDLLDLIAWLKANKPELLGLPSAVLQIVERGLGAEDAEGLHDALKEIKALLTETSKTP